MYFTKKYILFFLILLNTNLDLLIGQGENFYNYSIAEGLPQSQVFAICQDSAGYIWAGTQGGGIAIFDGQKFRKLPNGLTTLRSAFISYLFAATDHTVWIGTTQGLFFYKNEKLREIKSSGITSMMVNSITQWDGNIFVGSDKGLFAYDPQKETLTSGSLDFKLSSIVNDVKVVNGQLWVATDKGLFIQKNPEASFTKVSGLPFPNINLIQSDHFGHVLLGVYGYGIIKIDVKSFKITSLYDNKLWSKTKSILILDDDMIWLATENNGIVKLNTCTGEFSGISEDSGLSSSKIRILMEDSWGNIWIGTSGAGLIKKTNQLFKHHNMIDNGFGGNRVYSVTKDKTDKIWMAVSQDNIGYFDGSYFRKVNNDSLKIGVKIKTLAVDTTGALWIGSEGKGVYCLDSTGTKRFQTSDGSIADDWIIQVIADVENKIWIATRSSGIQCIIRDSDSTFQTLHFNKLNGLPDKYIQSMAEDKKSGRLWFGCRNGSVGYIDKKFKIDVFDKKNGLPEKPVNCITLDNAGNCYLGISGAGVFWTPYFSATSKINFSKITLPDKTYSTNIYSMACDSKENLWVGTENGVYKFIKGPSSELTFDMQHFKREDGFLGIENCHNSISIDDNDNIWFGTMNGLVYYNARFETGVKAPPRLRLSEILLFNKPIGKSEYEPCFSSFADTDVSKLPYHQNHLSFSFDAVHLNYPDKLKYRYMLEGADPNWSSWSEEKRINFSGIAPGNYLFRVQSTFDENQVSNTTQVHFIISKPFWEESWFRILLFLMGAGIIIMVIKIREAAIKKKVKAQNRELSLKNELLTLEQKALQLQMNPHFIFNALNSIQSLVVNNDPEAARAQIQNFALLMRGILNTSRSKTVSLNTEIDLLTKYLTMEQFCQKNKFNFSIEISNEINAEETELPTMLIQPFVENAVIHGISHLSSPGDIKINFELEDQTLTCIITDNGVGRKRASELSPSKEGHTSLGMEVTGQRLDAMKNQPAEAGKQIIDLYDDSGHAAGTKVILKIPVHLTL
ncbi:MAG: histidine kinase [Saprospiraceae bacterium]|nr:histidine kinase [Saprospiraceae bacterium]